MTNTRHQRWLRAALLAVVAGLLLLLPLLAVAQNTGQLQTHIVQQGESAVGIAARYGLSLAQLVEANHLRDLNLSAGTQLVIPAPAGQAGKTHLVRPWETLPSIAARYGVSVVDIMLANRLARPGGLYVGQRLVIPAAAEPSPTPPSPATPVACPGGCAPISIAAPARGSPVTSPVLVQGRGAAYEQNLALRVLDATGYEIGKGNAMIDGPLGAIGPYSGVVTFTVPASTQPGRIQVYSQSPADGAIDHLASVTVMLQGAGLDEAVEQLKLALEGEDYDALALLMTDPWNFAFLRSESLSFSRKQALQQLEAIYLGPGQVFVDLSVDGRNLLAGQVSFTASVTHVVFSTGWGADQSDDALLLFSTDATGQARWSGMVYIFGALRPY